MHLVDCWLYHLTIIIRLKLDYMVDGFYQKNDTLASSEYYRSIIITYKDKGLLVREDVELSLVTILARTATAKQI